MNSACVFVFCYLHAVSVAVYYGFELSMNTGAKSARDYYIDTWSHLLFLWHAPTNVVGELTSVCAQSWSPECTYLDCVCWNWELFLIDPVHVHSYTYFKLLRIYNLAQTWQCLSSNCQAHHNFSLGCEIYSKSWIQPESWVIWASTCVILVPLALKPLTLHPLTLWSHCSHNKRLVTFDL